MPTKTIYVADDDIETFNQAKKLAGKNLSAVIVKSLKEFIFRKESQQKGLEEIRFAIGNHGVEGEKRFLGRLILDWRGVDRGSDRIMTAKVYLTAKNQLATTIEYRGSPDTWDTGYWTNPTNWRLEHRLLIAKTVDEFNDKLPNELLDMIREAVEHNDDSIEFLDI